MSIADELRRDAEAALKEDGMYYSGEYLDGIAKRVEEVEAENAKLRELVETMRVDMREMLDIIDKSSDTRGYCRYYGECLDAAEGIMRELGIEVG